MINYWQQEDGVFIKKDKESIDTKQRLWVDCRNVTTKDITILEENYNIEDRKSVV